MHSPLKGNRVVANMCQMSVIRGQGPGLGWEELPEGNVVTTEVGKLVKAFDSMKVGDSIHARLTKAIAISVETP